MLTLQPICRFSLASTLFGRTCPQKPLAVGLRSSFVSSGSIALDHYFLPFFSAPLHLRSHDDTDPRPVFAANRSCLSFSCFFSAYLPMGFNYTGLDHGFTARHDCAVHKPSSLGPRSSLGLLAYLSHRSHVLTPVWLRSPFRLSKLTPFRVVFFRRNRFRRNAFATYLVLLVFLK